MQLLWLKVTMNNFFHLKINIQELSILGYIIRVTFRNEVEKENEEDTIFISTQELSVDARERRSTKKPCLYVTSAVTKHHQSQC